MKTTISLKHKTNLK